MICVHFQCLHLQQQRSILICFFFTFSPILHLNHQPLLLSSHGSFHSKPKFKPTPTSPWPLTCLLQGGNRTSLRGSINYHTILYQIWRFICHRNNLHRLRPRASPPQHLLPQFFCLWTTALMSVFLILLSEKQDCDCKVLSTSVWIVFVNCWNESGVDCTKCVLNDDPHLRAPWN